MATTSNTTTQAALLKELYTLPPVRVLNDKSFLHDKLQKEQAQMDYSGKQVRFPVTVQRALGRGARLDGGELPVSIAEVDVEATATMAFNYYALEWTEALEEVSKSKEGSFENAVARKMKNVATDMAKELNRQWYNADGKGVLATSTTTTTSATQTVSSVQYIHVGDVLDQFPSGSDTATSTGKVVQSISDANSTVTFTTSVTGTTGDRWVITGSLNSEIPAGLRAITAAGRTLHGINSSTYPMWDGENLSISSVVAGESYFEQLSDNIGENGRGDMDTYLTTRGIRRRLADEFASQRRYLNESSLNIKAGYRTLEVNGHECVIDDDCPKGFVFGISRDALKLMQLTKPGFLESSETNGAVIELKDSTTAGRKVAAWQAWYRYHVTMVCTDPGRTGRIPDAEDDAAKQAV
jgi:hypothetical protein